MSVTSLDLYVPIKLDKPRKIKLTPDDITAVCDELNAAVPARRTEVTLFTLLSALAGMDWKAWDVVLSWGLRHQDPKLENVEDVHGILMRFAQNDGDMVQLGLLVRRAMMLSGALPRTIWEQIDAKAWRKYLDKESAAKEQDTAEAEIPTGALESAT